MRKELKWSWVFFRLTRLLFFLFLQLLLSFILILWAIDNIQHHPIAGWVALPFFVLAIWALLFGPELPFFPDWKAELTRREDAINLEYGSSE